MTGNDDFRIRPGRIRSTRAPRTKSFLAQALKAAQKAGVAKVVFSSASSVYGDTDETMDESHPLGARTMYGASTQDRICSA